MVVRHGSDDLDEWPVGERGDSLEPALVLAPAVEPDDGRDPVGALGQVLRWHRRDRRVLAERVGFGGLVVRETLLIRAVPRGEDPLAGLLAAVAAVVEADRLEAVVHLPAQAAAEDEVAEDPPEVQRDTDVEGVVVVDDDLRGNTLGVADDEALRVESEIVVRAQLWLPGHVSLRPLLSRCWTSEGK